MKLKRRGFTLIEVSLFLALTGALFVMVAVGVANSIYQQRFNDAVQDFAEFFRGVYGGAENVQNNIGGGRSEDKAIYGKLVVFGAEEDLAGAEDSNIDKQAIFTYDVIGGINKPSNSGLINALKEVNISIFEDLEEGASDLKFAGRAESYSLRWGASVERTDSKNNFVGAVLVVRHPKSGTINTLYYKGNNFKEINNLAGYHREKILIDTLDSFTMNEADFCVSLEETAKSLRRDVQISRNASNASGINIIASEDNPCAL